MGRNRWRKMEGHGENSDDPERRIKGVEGNNNSSQKPDEDKVDEKIKKAEELANKSGKSRDAKKFFERFRQDDGEER